MAANSKCSLSRKSRLELREIHKNYPGSTLHFNHCRSEVRVYDCRGQECIMIFGELGRFLCELSDEQTEMTLGSVMQKIREMK